MQLNQRERVRNIIMVVVIVCIVAGLSVGLVFINIKLGGEISVKGLINVIFTIITIMLAIIALAGIVSWHQIKERKEYFDKVFKELKDKTWEELKELKEATGVSYLSSAGHSLSQAAASKGTPAMCHFYLEKTRNLAEKLEKKLPEDFRVPRLKGHISFLSDNYQEAFRQFEIAKQKVDREDREYPNLCYTLAVACMVSCKKLKDRAMARRARDIIDWLIEAFNLEPRLMDIIVDDPDFRNPGNSTKRNPLVEKLEELNKENKGVKDLENGDVKEWTDSLRDFLKDC